MFAILDFSDFAIILCIVAVFSGGGGAAASAYLRPAHARLVRIEHKLDLVMTHLGLDYTPPAVEEWQELAAEPGRKIAAIKAYREQHGPVGLAEAKQVVEDYIQGGSGRG